MSATQIAAAVAALLVAGFLVRRWGRLAGERKLVGIGLVLALAVYASGVLSELPIPRPSSSTLPRRSVPGPTRWWA